MNEALLNDDSDEPPCIDGCCHNCGICFSVGCRYDEWLEIRKGRNDKEIIDENTD